MPNKKRENESRSYYSIHFITLGEGSILCKRGEEYRLKRGDVFVNFPNAYLDYGPSRINPWSYIWLSFDGNSKIDDVFALCGITREKPFCRIENFNKCYSLINSMLAARDYGKLRDVKCYGYFLEKLCEMIDRSRPVSSKQKQLLFSAMLLMSANMMLKLSLAEIASSVCCSQSYLSLIFSKHLKSTLIEFQQKFRIAVACEKLRKDRCESIEQISHRVGYDDPLTSRECLKSSRV